MIKQLLWTAALGFSLTSQALTSEKALAIALKNSPRLQAARANHQAATRSAEIAGLWRNPELELKAEGLGGNNDGFNAGEYAMSLTQTIPLGGKSRNELAIAQQVVWVTSHVLSETEIELTVQLRTVFADVLAQQEIAKVHNEQEKLSREFVAVVKKRNKAGVASELEVIQANLALEEVLMEQKCCLGDLDVAKKRLASLMGVSLKEIGVPDGNFYELEKLVPPTVDKAHPALLRLQAQETMVRAEAALAKSQNAGDLSLGAGVKHEATDEAQSFMVSISIPLSIRKTGRVERAAALLRADAVNAQREQIRRDLQQQLDKMMLAYQKAKMEANQYKNHILPMAEQAYVLSRRGYDAGRYTWMELLTTQQNLADIRIRYVETLLNAQKALAELSKFR